MLHVILESMTICSDTLNWSDIYLLVNFVTEIDIITEVDIFTKIREVFMEHWNELNMPTESTSFLLCNLALHNLRLAFVLILRLSSRQLAMLPGLEFRTSHSTSVLLPFLATKTIKDYGISTFSDVCRVKLTLEWRIWFKIMTQPWVMDNNSVKGNSGASYC